MKKIIINLLLILTFFPLICFSKMTEEEGNNKNQAEQKQKEPPAVGNFAVPSSQQARPLISFGQSNLDKNVAQIYMFPATLVGEHKNYIDIAPSFVYGLTDNLTFVFTTPYAVHLREEERESSGISDYSAQLEYGFYNKSTSSFQEQASFVALIKAPTGSDMKQPPTGFGSPSYFLGGVFSRLYLDWYAFTSPGLLLTTPHNNVKIGNQFVYQFGLGKNISYVTNKWIFNWLIEADGQYTETNHIFGIADPNTGGNVVLLTPSLRFSTEKMALQGGVGFPIVQNLHGNQFKNRYLIAANVTWTFK
jgi:hypothetical protein